MMTMQKPRYRFGMRTSLPYAATVELVKLALKEQGFAALTEIDGRVTPRRTLDIEDRPHVILGACNSPLAHRALTAESRGGTVR